MALRITIKGDGIKRMREAVEALGEKKAKKAYSRSLNEAGKPAANRAIKAVAKQMGVSSGLVAKRAGMKHRRATAESLSYELNVTGGHLLLKDFNPTQFKKGVKAAPWARRIVFKSTFVVEKLNNNVFKRNDDTGDSLKKLFGPAVPKEIVQGETAKVWTSDVADRLNKRIAHHIKQMSNGAIT